MILIRGVPFLQHNPLPIRPRLRSNHFLPSVYATQPAFPALPLKELPRRGHYLENFNGIVRVDFDSDFLAQSVIRDDFDHNHLDSVAVDQVPIRRLGVEGCTL